MLAEKFEGHFIGIDETLAANYPLTTHSSLRYLEPSPKNAFAIDHPLRKSWNWVTPRTVIQRFVLVWMVLIRAL